ncbi:MAE_28990/MAE_18760 family HEPN-like nuclease [Stenotrophomonas sp.]|uniref:MAE_28990/MAE_18760 family HEPN-like nuclease n=1 Tax=Stenotrophomonas sp. TaxID=69392 RepID=UPI0019C69822|nr:MAE_28990/MAE_18760 family HEPN-like nuclease [Stenotrophomonas sp.]MBD3826153.1 hypothetical protein [Stenotrophomonas sp.]
MSDLRIFFNERLEEVDAHLSFLSAMEQSGQGGVPQFQRVPTPVTPMQQKILYSTVYLQLYNLIEATMSRCIDEVAAAAGAGSWAAADLIPQLRKEWVRSMAKTHVDQAPDKRLVAAVEMASALVSSVPVSDFKIDRGGGGNWDDKLIEKISERLGFELRLSAPIMTRVKQKVRNDLGPLGLVKSLRNQLAHGAISFVECAGETDTTALVSIRDTTEAYMRGVMETFVSYIDGLNFVVEDRRTNP